MGYAGAGLAWARFLSGTGSDGSLDVAAMVATSAEAGSATGNTCTAADVDTAPDAGSMVGAGGDSSTLAMGGGAACVCTRGDAETCGGTSGHASSSYMTICALRTSAARSS